MSLTYGGTEGSSGSDASHERAAAEAASGAATDRQALILAELRAAGSAGLTWREMAENTGRHHGQVTGSLSNLHRDLKVARLTAKRGRCSIYVLPEFVGSRATVPQGRVSRALAAVGYPYRHDAHLVLGPEVHATLDGESIVWRGRRYHPVDSHDARRGEEPGDDGKRPLFDM